MLKNEVESLLCATTHSPLVDLKYLRPVQVPRRYPFSRSLLYELLAAGKIESILMRKPGGVRGIRLVSVASIEAYLARLAREQRTEKLMPVMAREEDTEKTSSADSRKKEVARVPQREDTDKAPAGKVTTKRRAA
jgi:hypothetical protein